MGKQRARRDTGVHSVGITDSDVDGADTSRRSKPRQGDDKTCTGRKKGSLQYDQTFPHEDRERSMGVSLCIESHGERDLLVFRVPACTRESRAVVGVHRAEEYDDDTKSPLGLIYATVKRWVAHSSHRTSSFGIPDCRDS